MRIVVITINVNPTPADRAGLDSSMIRAMVLTLLCLAACRTGAVQTDARTAPDPCLVTVAADRPLDTVTVVFTSREASERFVLRHRQGAEGGCAPVVAPFDLIAADPPLLAPFTGGPVIRVVTAPDADPRDLLDQGGDLLVTSDPSVLDYARRREEFRVLPLAWATTHVLVTPPGASPIITLPAADRAALARDAVRADARAAEPPWWWEGEPSCFVQDPPPAARLRDITVPEGDPIARDLAERLLALTRPSGNGRRVTALGPAAFSAALARGTADAFVTAFPRVWSSDCRGVPNVPVGAHLLPLVDSRAHAIVRPGIPPFLSTPDGGVRLLPHQP